MIKYFSHTFIGDILDGDRLGLDGPLAKDRRYPNERLTSAFENARETAQLMEELGYDMMWLAEHHFQPEGYECIPNVLMLALWLAQHTGRLKFGCAFNIAPMWHPLRLAEDFATVDVLTGGRVTFGVGRGYHTREVETFGMPMQDAEANRDLFEEQLEVILKAFNEESFSHRGKHYTIPPEVPYRGYTLRQITMVPRPLRRPVEVWQPIVSGSPRGIDFMARHGVRGIMAGSDSEKTDAMVREFQAANARHGREMQLGEGLVLGLWCYIGRTEEEAIQALRPSFEEHSKFAGPLGISGYGNENLRAMGPDETERYIASRADYEKGLARGVWTATTPAGLIAKVRGLEEAYPGLEQVSLSRPTGMGHRQHREQLALFAKEVMPAFKERAR